MSEDEHKGEGEGEGEGEGVQCICTWSAFDICICNGLPLLRPFFRLGLRSLAACNFLRVV